MIYQSNDFFFFLLIPLISFLYSSIGHGGATGYLAIMSLLSVPTILMKQTALLLNLFVSGIAFIQFYRAGYFKKISLFTLHWDPFPHLLLEEC